VWKISQSNQQLTFLQLLMMRMHVLAGIYENLNQICPISAREFLYYSILASDDQLGGGGTNDKLMQAEDMLCNYGANMTMTSGMFAIRASTVQIL
jgi:hypothetical protein